MHWHTRRGNTLTLPFSRRKAARVTMFSKPRGKSKPQDLILDTSDLVLTVVRDAARIAPLPYLQDAATLALVIVNVVQGVKDNKNAFRRLANDACGLVYAILCRHTTADRVATGVSADLLDNLRELLKTLASIERFANKEISRGLIMRIIMYKSDLGKILEFRERLRQSLDIFGLKSSITIQENLAHIVSQQGEILQAFRGQDSRIEGVYDETQISNAGDLIGRDTEASHSSRTPSLTSAIPAPTASFPRHLRPSFPHIQSSHGTFAMTSVGGDHNVVDSSHVTNTNSGNTTTTVTTNSNNDSSVQVRGPGRRGRNY